MNKNEIMIDNIFKEKIFFKNNFIQLKNTSKDKNQQHTNNAFSEKWFQYEKTNNKKKQLRNLSKIKRVTLLRHMQIYLKLNIF